MEPTLAHEDDPLAAIYALNLGDFVVEHFMSDALLARIQNRVDEEPARLRRQLEELIEIYSLDRTLGLLGLTAAQDRLVLDVLCRSLADLLEMGGAHLFQTTQWRAGHPVLALTGSALPADHPGRQQAACEFPLVEETQTNSLGAIIRRGEVVALQPLPEWATIGGASDPLGLGQAEQTLWVPLRQGSAPVGLLLLTRSPAEPLNPAMASLLATLGRLLVTGLRIQQLVHEAKATVVENPTDFAHWRTLRAQITESIADLGQDQQSFIEALAELVNARHPDTAQRAEAVAELARELADTLGLNEKTVDLVYLAGRLGSLHRLRQPTELLNRPGPLSPAEWDALREDPNVGMDLLTQVMFLADVQPYVRAMQERWDGSGGPDGLQGRSIPLGARILAVADAFHAMTSPRAYRREPMSPEAALSTIQAEAGAKWDPDVVGALACKLAASKA